MKIQFRIFLGFAAILFLTFYFLISWILPDMNVQPKKSMEESLVDTAHLLAVYLEQESVKGEIALAKIKDLINLAEKREFKAQIYELNKKNINLGVYITDRNGIVLFHSKNSEEVGKNYYHWLDVHKTLIGEYGARTTRIDPHDPVSSIAYIAAPVDAGGKIVGSVTVFKPWESIHSFTKSTRKRVIIAAIIGFVLSVFLSYLISLWVTRPIWKLTRYADKVKEGEIQSLPNLGTHELKILGDSLEKMRDALEGKKYIENYIQNLAHQIKGPLSSIKGAAELLTEDLPEQERKKFILNDQKERERIQQIVDKLLQLAFIEKRKELVNVEIIDFHGVVSEVLEELFPLIDQKKTSIINKIKKSCGFKGEAFLIKEAVLNLLLNALDSTPPKGTIEISIKTENQMISLIIEDNGTGIPPYALAKVFDRFYSLPRPLTGEKSSGLGLSIVKEIALLHKGDIEIQNNKGDGVTAVFRVNRGDWV